MKYNNWLSTAWNWCVEKFNWVKTQIGNLWGTMWVRLKDLQLFSKIGNFFSTAGGRIASFFQPIFTKLSEMGIWKAISTVAGPVISILTLIPLVKNIVDMLKNKNRKPETITEKAVVGSSSDKKALGKKFAKTAFEKSENSYEKLSSDVDKNMAAFKKDKFESMFNDIPKEDLKLTQADLNSEFAKFLRAKGLNETELRKQLIVVKAKNIIEYNRKIQEQRNIYVAKKLNGDFKSKSSKSEKKAFQGLEMEETKAKKEKAAKPKKKKKKTTLSEDLFATVLSRFSDDEIRNIDIKDIVRRYKSGEYVTEKEMALLFLDSYNGTMQKMAQ